MIQSDILTNEDLGKQLCCILKVMFNSKENVQRPEFVWWTVKPFYQSYNFEWDSEREKDGVVYVILCDWDSKDRVKW